MRKYKVFFRFHWENDDCTYVFVQTSNRFCCIISRTSKWEKFSVWQSHDMTQCAWHWWECIVGLRLYRCGCMNETQWNLRSIISTGSNGIERWVWNCCYWFSWIVQIFTWIVIISIKKEFIRWKRLIFSLDHQVSSMKTPFLLKRICSLLNFNEIIISHSLSKHIASKNSAKTNFMPILCVSCKR